MADPSVAQLKRNLLAAIDANDPAVGVFKPYMQAMPDEMVLTLCARVDDYRAMLELFVGAANTAKLLPVIAAFNENRIKSSAAGKLPP